MFRLKELRESRRLTQDGLGKKFGLAGSTISLYERGQRQADYETLIKFADFFDVSVDYLLGREVNFPDCQRRRNLQRDRNDEEELERRARDDLAELADRYNTHSREALKHQERAQMCMAGILRYQADKNADELRKVLEMTDTLRLM